VRRYTHSVSQSVQTLLDCAIIINRQYCDRSQKVYKTIAVYWYNNFALPGYFNAFHKGTLRMQHKTRSSKPCRRRHGRYSAEDRWVSPTTGRDCRGSCWPRSTSRGMQNSCVGTSRSRRSTRGRELAPKTTVFRTDKCRTLSLTTHTTGDYSYK